MTRLCQLYPLVIVVVAATAAVLVLVFMVALAMGRLEPLAMLRATMVAAGERHAPNDIDSANISAAINTVIRFFIAFHPFSFYPRRHETG